MLFIMIIIKYLKCTQTHNWDTNIIKKGDAGKLISVEKDDYAIIELNNSFRYKIQISNSIWKLDFEAFFLHELKMDSKYIEKYKNITDQNMLYPKERIFINLLAELFSSNVDYSKILKEIMCKIDSILMDQALS